MVPKKVIDVILGWKSWIQKHKCFLMWNAASFCQMRIVWIERNNITLVVWQCLVEITVFKIDVRVISSARHHFYDFSCRFY